MIIYMTVYKHYHAPMEVIKVVKIIKRLAFSFLNEDTLAMMFHFLNTKP